MDIVMKIAKWTDIIRRSMNNSLDRFKRRAGNENK
jgi:hypothetical protein